MESNDGGVRFYQANVSCNPRDGYLSTSDIEQVSCRRSESWAFGGWASRFNDLHCSRKDPAFDEAYSTVFAISSKGSRHSRDIVSCSSSYIGIFPHGCKQHDLTCEKIDSEIEKGDVICEDQSSVLFV